MKLDCQYEFTVKHRIRDDYPGQILFLANGAAIILNPTAQMVVSGINSNVKPTETAQKMQNQYPDIPMGQIEDDIREFLSELNSCDVIQAVEG